MEPLTKTAVAYNVDLMARDMAARGWMQTDLARMAQVSNMTVSRWFTGERRTAKTGAKLAFALGYSPDRYVLKVRRQRDAVA